MAIIKVKLRHHSVADREGTIFYQIIHLGVKRRISTGYRLYSREWDTVCGRIILEREDTGRNQYLRSILMAIENDLNNLRLTINYFEHLRIPYTTDHIVARYQSNEVQIGILAFSKGVVAQMNTCGRLRTAERYTTVLNSFKRFMKDRDIPLQDLTPNLIADYEVYLLSNGLCNNTVSFYMRGLRAIYNRAVDKDLILQRHPFRRVYTGIDKTRKRAIPLHTLRHIKSLDLSFCPAMAFARDIFMFSFYTRGMSIVDIAYLLKENLVDGILSYRRHKTGQALQIKWEQQMEDLVQKYYNADSPYLLPLIKKPDGNVYRQYKSTAHLINSYLKKLGIMIGLKIPLTTYVARHTWASIAKSHNIPISTISEAMGHDSEKTTRIYLASLDSSEVDNANSKILSSL